MNMQVRPGLDDDTTMINDETVRIGNIENVNGKITVSVTLPKRFRQLTAHPNHSSKNVYNDIIVQLGASSVEPIYGTGQNEIEIGLKMIFNNLNDNKSAPLRQIFDTRSGKSPVEVITAIIDDHIAFTNRPKSTVGRGGPHVV